LISIAVLLALRGKCREYAEAAVATDPSLEIIRGWYYDPFWGRQEHWWTKRSDGTIVDPTASQFPFGGVEEWYEEYTGVFPCQGCGREVREETHYEGCCSYECFGRMVGLS
jgi:hypothetical protein